MVPGSPIVSTPAPASWLTLAGIFLAATLLAMFLASLTQDSAFVEGQYIPVTNDSFYHARRILDTLENDSGFYEYDERLHVPEGAWIPWPWAYDYLVAKATTVALWLKPALDPMAFIAYLPVAWIAVNALLFLAALSELGLSSSMRALAMLAFALSPLTQLLHAVGMIDHHYIEHTFVLLNIWLGLRWFKDPTNARRAAALGLALGLAPGFHNGLFLLQLPTLLCVFILWLRGHVPARQSVVWFSATLIATTLLVLLPSQAFQSGIFEFALLSWFHFYVAICTSLALLFMAWRPYTLNNFLGLVLLSVILIVPIAAQALRGAAFFLKDISVLDGIVEARSPYRLFVDTFGPTKTLSHYSWLLLLAPILLIYYLWRLLRESEPRYVYYAVVVVFGLALMLTQFRFHYFGLFAMITAGLVVVERLSQRFNWHRGAVIVGVMAVLALAYQPPLKERLFLPYALGGDPNYQNAREAFLDLDRLCEREPGVVLANHDDGNFILFHSDCSVIANNFILRAADEKKIDELNRLMRSPIERIREDRTDIKYVLLRANDFSTTVDGVQQIVAANSLARHLLIDAQSPPGFELVRDILLPQESGKDEIYARLYRVLP